MPKIKVSYDVQDTANGDHLGTAVFLLDEGDDIGRLVETVLMREAHDDLVITVEFDT